MMLWRRLGYLLPWRRRAAERDMQEELRSIAAMAERGELGNLTIAAEDARAEWGWTRLEHIAPGARDFKTRVQEALQRRGGRPPVYELIAVAGPDHARSFEVAVRLDGQELGRGEGRSKLEAEQAAAEQALEALGPQA